MDLRTYMPERHRALIADLEGNEDEIDIRAFIAGRAARQPGLAERYNACIERLYAFRKQHLELARLYIFEQEERRSSNPTAAGTGGTPFMDYLRKHCQEVLDHRVPAASPQALGAVGTS
jgi:indoleamine 2,3-dioxygenase